MQIIVFPVQNSTFHHVSQSQKFSKFSMPDLQNGVWFLLEAKFEIKCFTGNYRFQFGLRRIFDEFCNIAVLRLVSKKVDGGKTEQFRQNAFDFNHLQSH